jgi:hypothetical protein
MRIQYRAGLFALSIAVSSAAPLSAANAIGVASTLGTMEVNSASVRTTANIPDGASVQTNGTPGQIRLQSGVQVNLSENTSATIYSDHLQLKQGTTQYTAHQNYSVDALGYRIEGKDKTVSARIAYDRNRILVTAVQSPINVSRDNNLLAQVNPGETYYFNSDDPPATPPAKPAGKAGRVAKGGLSNAAKWGIVVGAAGAVTATAVGVYVAGDKASR